MTEAELQKQIEAKQVEVIPSTIPEITPTDPLAIEKILNLIKEYTPYWETLRKTSASGKFKVGNGTNADSVITGVGFKPKMIRITAWRHAANYGFSVGSQTDDMNWRNFMQYRSGGNWYCDPGDNVISVYDDSGNIVGNGQISSFDSDGFTINWLYTSGTINFIYECYG